MNTTLIHFNDVYNAEKSPRFVAAVHAAQEQGAAQSGPCFTIFSGDAFSPSTLSTSLRGKQMIPILNALKIDCACLGNHDLDFGLAEFGQLEAQCTFPWICSNVRSIDLNQPLGGCEEYVVLEKKGLRILVLGLIECGWIETLSSIEPEDIEFEEYSDYVKRRVPEITHQQGPFDMVIAASHMRMPNDYALAEDCAGLIDIVLGGHDHHYEDTVRKDLHILNSGSDFGDFTIVKVNSRDDVTTERVTITQDMEEDAEIANVVRGFSEQIAKNMNVALGVTKADLDARFSEVRTKETNCSNFLASVLARATGADVALFNAGSIRADRIIPKGPFKVQDLCDLLPVADPVVVVALTGDKLVAALENGVSQYPAMEGRFPCVDGVRFSFDPSQPPGSRIVPGSVYVRMRVLHAEISTLIKRRGKERSSYKEDHGRVHAPFTPIDPQKIYHVCTKAYLLAGKDGYDAFVGAPIVMDEELCPPLPTLVRNCFTEIAVIRQWEGIACPAVLKAASKFKRSVSGADVDPFAIEPTFDGRIVNIMQSS